MIERKYTREMREAYEDVCSIVDNGDFEDATRLMATMISELFKARINEK